MILPDHLHRAWALLLVLGVLGGAPATSLGLPPAPLNDDPASAEVIGPDVPILVLGTTVLANDSISVTTLPAPVADVAGPDVFYSFTPNATDVYRIQLLPWQHAPLRSSDHRFTIYIQDSTDAFIGGAQAPGSARPVHFDVNLTASETYRIGVDYYTATYDNFPFTLIVDVPDTSNPDDCATALTLPSTLPAVLLSDIDPALADFTFTQGTGRCAVSGTTPTTAPGNDHVYHFVPTADGDYAVELVGSGFDAVVYVMDSCPGLFPVGCLGASNHSTSGTTGGKHELVVVTLEATKDYYIYVDNGSTTAITGNYVLIIDDAFNYEINEFEPNDVALDATPATVPLNGGQLVGPEDEDWYELSGLTGARVYAWANNGGSSNSTLDTDLGFFASDGSTLVEFDDEDGDGANAPLNDLRYVYSTTSPVIGGAQFTSDAPHYLRVTDQSLTGTVHRYRMHIGIEPAGRTPLAECEPNNTIVAADYTGKHYYSGVIDTVDDSDFYAFEATVGDRVFVGFDGDPERDATGSDSAQTDPNAFHGKLVIYDPAGDVLISDVSDSNSIQSAPDYPAQGGFFFARTTGTHYAEVMPQSTSSQVGPTETYHLAVFLNDAAPDLAEDVDPVVTLTPDFVNNKIDAEATDNAPGDSGVCDLALVDNTNLQITNVSGLPGPVVTFTIELVNPAEGGIAKLVVADCEGNTFCQVVKIDIDPPICDGFNFSSRTPFSLHDPIHVPDNDLTGIEGTIDVADAGLITNVTVTMTIDALDTGDLDIYLISPTGTSVELVTDRMSSLGIDMVDVTFDDDADVILPILGSAAPYTGSWLPEDPLGLAQLDGETAQGTWRLNVIDDASSADFGATLVHWSLDVQATFAGPETFAGTASDTVGVGAGIDSIVLTGATNVQLNLPPGFTPGDQVVEYTVTLIDSTQNGSGTVTVTDLQENTCQSVVSLNGFADGSGPDNSGSVTTDLTFKKEVQEVVPESDLDGVVSTINLPDSFTVGEVEVALTVDSENQGRMAAKLTHGGEFSSLVNRISMDERGSSGNTKNSFDVILDDDAPQEDDIHDEPSLGTIATLGLHQPDGRGEFFGDGITIDERDNMLFTLAGLDAFGDWEMLVADARMMSASDNIFRRWALTLKSPCGPDHYVGRAIDLAPGAGVCTIDLDVGATNLAVVASFTPGDEVVDYRVDLIDPTLPGSGTLEITDCASNVTTVGINLVEASEDVDPPVITGGVNLVTFEYEGTATDNEVTDGGIVSVALAPFSDNLQVVSVVPDPPSGAGTVDFVIGLVNPAENGRGYVQVADDCGWRSYALVEIDANGPVCTGSVGTTKRYFSGDLLLDIPDANPAGVSSSIVVSDIDVVSDVDLTFNITHPYDDDIDLTLTSPATIALFSDIGSTGNDFIDTTLDDEAPSPIPDSSSEAPFTGSYQPEGGPALSVLDGVPASGTYTLRVVDDAANNTGSFDSWSLLIESSTFPQRYDGRAEDGLFQDSGVCTIELLPGGQNLTFVIDAAFKVGDAIVRYSVEPTDPEYNGFGTVRVTDCAGNFCDVPIELFTGDVCDYIDAPLCMGDANGDGVVTPADVGLIKYFYGGTGDFALCHYDVNCDGSIDPVDVGLAKYYYPTCEDPCFLSP